MQYAIILLLAMFVILPLGGCTKKNREQAPARDGWITDRAGILAPDAKAAMAASLENYEKETCHQILVLIVQSLEGEEIRKLSERTATAWNIGQEGLGNGILLTIAVQDKKMRIDAGTVFEWFVEQGQAEKILHESIAPYFGRRMFAEGIGSGLAEIMEAARQKEIPPDHRPTVCRD